jgi:hypothetical protein
VTGRKHRKKAPSAAQDAASERWEFAVTILLDGVVILTAIVVRAVLLMVLHKLIPEDREGWAIKRLEWIIDVGMVSAAVIFTVFDLLKRLLRGYRHLRQEISGRSPDTDSEP